MNSEIQTSAIPLPSYSGHNGFLQQWTNPEAINDKNVEQVIQLHRRAQFFFEYQGRPVPSFEQMQAEVELDELDMIDERINALKSQHLQDLERIYALSAAEYEQEVKDQYISRDQTAGYQNSEPERAAWQAELMTLYDYSKNTVHREWQDIYEQVRHSYLTQVLALKDSKQKLQRAREQMFPLSKEDFHSKNKDIQLRAARFLVATPAQQERSVNEFGWAWRQVQPLIDVFKKDEVFAADIRSLVIMEANVRDPRKR